MGYLYMLHFTYTHTSVCNLNIQTSLNVWERFCFVSRQTNKMLINGLKPNTTSEWGLSGFSWSTFAIRLSLTELSVMKQGCNTLLYTLLQESAIWATTKLWLPYHSVISLHHKKRDPLNKTQTALLTEIVTVSVRDLHIHLWQVFLSWI